MQSPCPLSESAFGKASTKVETSSPAQYVSMGVYIHLNLVNHVRIQEAGFWPFKKNTKYRVSKQFWSRSPEKLRSY